MRAGTPRLWMYWAGVAELPFARATKRKRRPGAGLASQHQGARCHSRPRAGGGPVQWL